ncbi:MAG: LysM peptidoglycan-binding domain-containing protein [Rhodobacteraceae bacterium]|nr:LysM peptidoglycan-binding domain-containing protein [Paracoccaceae bacterium]
MNAQLEIKFLTAGSYGGRGMKLSQGLWAVIAVVVAAGLGAYIWISGQGTAPKEAAAVEQVATAAPKAETAPVVDTEEAAPEPVVEEEPAAPEEPVVEEVQEAEAEVEAEPTPEVVETPVIRRPVIEVARVDPSGEVLLAGQGTAKAVIEALVDDAVAASGEIDGDENFVLFFDIEPSDQPRIISLRRVEDDEFIYSEQEVIVAPGQIKAPIAESVVSQEPVKQVAEATESDGDTVARISTQNVDEPTEESVETTQANVPAEVSETPAVGEAVEDAIEFAEAAPKNSIEDAADVEIAKAPEQPIQEEGVQKEETPTVMIADVSGVKIVSKAPASGENPEISLDAISYDEEGALTLAGRGVPSGLLRLYLNNAVIGETTTDALGAWSYDASALEPGVYTLRIDQLNADASKVLARMETPFKREARSKLQEQLSAAESPARINVVTVQPGNTLWGISRERYGQGILYVQVFEANRDKIRDPDLIYPGQIFNLPDDAAEEQ